MNKNISDKSIDAIICDLPYGMTVCTWDVIIPFSSLWKQYKRIIKDNGAIVLMSSQPFTSKLIMSNLEWFKYCWVWIKSQAVGHLNAYKMPMKNIEDICVFYKKQPLYNPQLRDKHKENIRPETTVRKKTSCYGDHSKKSKRQIPRNKTLPLQTIKFNNCQENIHPTQKPVNLLKYLIETYTKEEETVLDNCFGSGSTAIACHQTNRKFIGVEKEKKYFDIAVARHRNEIKQLRICDLK
jgi:site-specific DNA-methyltransferase (adenine-specific)